MDWLLDLGYFGLFLGSFIAATVVPFSSDVQLIAMLAVGGECVALCGSGHTRQLARRTDLLLVGLAR